MSAEAEKLELEELDRTLLKKNEPKPLGKYERIIQPCVAELVGTTYFVFIGCVSVIENVEAAGRPQPALVHGLAVAVFNYLSAKIFFIYIFLHLFTV
uniref:Aquaporin 8a, tandem duplicate 2 n=1 Tax=Sinocyclocheilus grahami TaxID=75366 RepID=A0A672K4V3_SINGR